jgi:hypothetical protein
LAAGKKGSKPSAITATCPGGKPETWASAVDEEAWNIAQKRH